MQPDRDYGLVVTVMHHTAIEICTRRGTHVSDSKEAQCKVNCFRLHNVNVKAMERWAPRSAKRFLRRHLNDCGSIIGKTGFLGRNFHRRNNLVVRPCILGLGTLMLSHTEAFNGSRQPNSGPLD